MKLTIYHAHLNFYGKRCINICHLHTGFNDYSLFWWANGRLMDIFFIRIN